MKINLQRSLKIYNHSFFPLNGIPYCEVEMQAAWKQIFGDHLCVLSDSWLTFPWQATLV